jgi:hypothetical protein
MRYSELSVERLTVNEILGAGTLPFTPGKKIFLDPTNGSDGNAGTNPARAKKTLSSAWAQAPGNKNDLIYLIGGASGLNLGAGFAWSKNLTHLIGLAPEAMMNQRARIGMSTTFTPFITVSGYGNLFKNIYTMHGTAVTDLVGWLISGARNSFHHVHFGGPMNAAQGGDAGYVGVDITGSENYLKRCTFGVDTIGRDEVTPNVRLGAGTLTIFEDCLFLVNLTDGDPVFVEVNNTSGYTWAIFKRCIFHAFNPNYATAMTKAFNITSGSSCAMIFDNSCQFVNVTALSAADKDQHIYLPRQFVSTTDTEGMISPQLTI